MKETLSIYRSRWQFLMERAGHGFFIMDKDLRIDDISCKFCNYVGIEKERLMNRRFHILFEPIIPQAENCFFRKNSNKENFYGKYRMFQKLGIVFIVYLDIIRIKENDSYLGIIGKIEPFAKQRTRQNNYNLTKREIEISELISLGLGNKDICNKLFLSPYTVKTHLKNIYQKAGVNTRSQLLVLIQKDGVITV